MWLERCHTSLSGGCSGAALGGAWPLHSASAVSAGGFSPASAGITLSGALLSMLAHSIMTCMSNPIEEASSATCDADVKHHLR